MSTTEYHLEITAPRAKFGKAVAAMKRYGGEFDGSVWVFEDRPHPAAAQWGDVTEVEVDDEYADYDYDTAAYR